jgi:hypothetical protein
LNQSVIPCRFAIIAWNSAAGIAVRDDGLVDGGLADCFFCSSANMASIAALNFSGLSFFILAPMGVQYTQSGGSQLWVLGCAQFAVVSQ